MKSGETLIRVAKHRVDELQKEMAQLNKKKDNVEERIQALADEIPREQAEASDNNGQVLMNYGAYAQHTLLRRQNLQTELKKVDGEINRHRLILQDAYSELKKFEKLEEARQRRADEDENKRSQSELDDLGLEAYRRQV